MASALLLLEEGNRRCCIPLVVELSVGFRAGTEPVHNVYRMKSYCLSPSTLRQPEAEELQ